MLSQPNNADDDIAEENVRIAEDAAKDTDYRTFTTNVTVSYFTALLQDIGRDKMNWFNYWK